MYLLGVDGGGSGCRVALADAAGRVLAKATGGTANIATDREAALENILAAVAAATRVAGADIPPDGIAAVLGLAGANVGGHADWVAARLPYARASVVWDVRIALAGAHGGGDGLVAIIGTGSAFAALRDGQVTTAGGWGYALGDEASGAWLGRAAMRRALHAVDGLEGITPLLQAILDAEGGPDAMAARAVRATPADIARHAPAVVAAADAGDPAALAILSEADASVAFVLDALADGAHLPVAFLGGLGPVYARRLASRYGTRIRPPAGDALDGALRMARDLAASEAGAAT